MEKEIDTLARTIYGEARGESLSGRVAIANVILNRIKRKSWFGKTVKEVCLKPWQFSCWNSNDPNRNKIKEVTAFDKTFKECLTVAELAVLGLLSDNTRGACHYHNNTVSPDWARNEPTCAIIGSHLFYNGVA